MSSFDTIIIGAGHNGLTAAALLGKRGRKVLVVERRDRIGGLAAKEEFHPDYYSVGCHQDTTQISREIVDSLNLERHGLQFHAESPGIFLPEEKGKGIVLYPDANASRAEIGEYSKRDAGRYEEYCSFIDRISGFVRGLLENPPPDVNSTKLTNLLSLGRTALKLRRLGDKDMTELLRSAPMCVADTLNYWFETELLKAGMSLPAVAHSFTGPWSPLTTLNLLMWECLAENPVIGGPAALTDALHKACKEAGVTVRLESEVTEILVEKGKVHGVQLKGGETLETRTIGSSCDPKTTFHALLAPRHLSMELDHRIKTLRARGTVAKVNLALNGPLEFSSRPGKLFEYARIASTLDGVEQAFDSIKYGEMSRVPALEVFVPTVAARGLAPEGHHVVSLLYHFAPYPLRREWTSESRKRLLDRAVTTLGKVTKGLEGKVVGSEVLCPRDIEARYGVANGNLLHGEHAIDQLFHRPTPETAFYRAPVEGLFLCGSGSHPGGGITCRPGGLGSKQI